MCKFEMPSYLFVQFYMVTSVGWLHTHVSCNAVPLVWACSGSPQILLDQVCLLLLTWPACLVDNIDLILYAIWLPNS